MEHPGYEPLAGALEHTLEVPQVIETQEHLEDELVPAVTTHERILDSGLSWRLQRLVVEGNAAGPRVVGHENRPGHGDLPAFYLTCTSQPCPGFSLMLACGSSVCS